MASDVFAPGPNVSLPHWRAALLDDADFERWQVRLETDRRHCQHLVRCTVGEQVRLFGIVWAVTFPAGSGASFTADMDDGTGHLRLLFPGRRRVDAVMPGAALEVSGVLVADSDGLPALVDPEIVAPSVPGQAP